eukprot:CAMPEP_0194071230 /NCGR_PEP_ID=MMETSP0009_2-20130614/88599_1 /TAXON_ID=210454 /ORGANISM="Grammatophora oceanica, Strain CCMP 410" /LENGTH=33 /DNA_ID= /DNA_START= /DNA_END= /DNA_ORIENTATION=
MASTVDSAKEVATRVNSGWHLDFFIGHYTEGGI